VMQQKDAAYYRSAIQYNEELSDFAKGLADRLENPEVARWARSVSKQHKFHARLHKKSLARVENNSGNAVATDDVSDEELERVVDISPTPTFSTEADR
jgi:hypothetical protein